MNNKLTAGVITALIVTIGAGLYVASNPNDDSVVSNPSASQQTGTSTQVVDDVTKGEQQPNQMYTLEDVAMHDSEQDCWTIINGSVYDLTSYIQRHPGNNNILSACGIDATSFFNGEKPGQLGGSNDHSTNNSALNQLERLKIGTLSQ